MAKKQKDLLNGLRILKLDRNFHVYIHGDINKVEISTDGKGKYVKLYYDEIR